jgi:hypothetical protein
MRTTVTEIRGQSLSHLFQQRQPIPTRALSPDGQQACGPVDVVQLHDHDLAGTKTESGQDKQHSVVTPPGRGVAVTTAQRSLHLTRLQ